MDARKLIGDRELQVEVVLVVLEADVEARPIALYELVLEEKGLDFICAAHEFEVVDAAHHLDGALRLGGEEIAANAIAKACGLADVDDLGAGVPKQVNTGSLGHRAQPFSNFFRGHRSLDCATGLSHP